MGVTVHFRGKLKGDEAFTELVRCVTEIAAAETLLTETFENSEVKLLRVREDEEAWDYVGPTKGIVLYLHEDCEPVRLEFDRDLYIQEWVKTQFAGVPTHLRLIKLLRVLQVFFESFKVDDEGEFWETSDENVLAKHMRQCNEAITELAKEHPNAQVKVKEPDGRFTDLIT
jgi:hypothetical protein